MLCALRADYLDLMANIETGLIQVDDLSDLRGGHRLIVVAHDDSDGRCRAL